MKVKFVTSLFDKLKMTPWFKHKSLIEKFLFRAVEFPLRLFQPFSQNAALNQALSQSLGYNTPLFP